MQEILDYIGVDKLLVKRIKKHGWFPKNDTEAKTLFKDYNRVYWEHELDSFSDAGRKKSILEVFYLYLDSFSASSEGYRIKTNLFRNIRKTKIILLKGKDNTVIDSTGISNEFLENFRVTFFMDLLATSFREHVLYEEVKSEFFELGLFTDEEIKDCETLTAFIEKFFRIFQENGSMGFYDDEGNQVKEIMDLPAKPIDKALTIPIKE